MNQAVQTPVAPAVTDNERRAIAYFAIGVGSEGSIAGRDVSNHLSFAGNTRNGVMTPVGNSGYSIGTLQTDLGQHPDVVPSLVDAYQQWARLQQPERTLNAAQRAQTIADLSRNGNTITAQGGRPMDSGIEASLNEFLRSDAGVTYIHNRDVAQVEELVAGIMPQVAQTAVYRNASTDDQMRLTAMIAKVQNQSGEAWTPRLLREMDNGTLNNVADVSGAIDRLLPRISGDRDYMETGRDAALQGTEVLIALRNADSRSALHQTWLDVVADPLVNPTQTGTDPARPQLSAEYATVKGLFLQKNEAPALIHALDQGGSYAYGRPRQEGQGRPTAGLYASGNDFVVWDRDGKGHSNTGGVWAELDRSDLVRTRNSDGTTDLDIVRNGQAQRLLHVDPQAPPLHATPDPGIQAPAEPAPYAPGAASSEHPLIEQARAAVSRLDAQLGRNTDQFSECMSHSVSCLALQNRFSRIDGVFLSQADSNGLFGQNVFVVQGAPDDPAALRAHMPTAQAAGSAVQDSQQRFADLLEQQSAQRESQGRQQEQPNPVRGGP